MQREDTAAEAGRAEIEWLRSMSPEQRMELGIKMSEDLRLSQIEGIRRRHPEYAEDEVRRALLRLRYGDDLARKVWPDSPLLDP